MSRPNKKRRSHLDDFHRNAAGDYVYEGAHYVCAAGDAARGRLLRRLWALGTLMAAATVAVGCVDAPGLDGCVWLLLPYVAEVAAVGSVVWALCRLSAGGARLRAYVYRASIKALPGRTIAAAVTAALGLCAEILYWILVGAGEKLPAAVVVCANQAITFVAALVLRRLVRRSAWEEEKRA